MVKFEERFFVNTQKAILDSRVVKHGVLSAVGSAFRGDSDLQRVYTRRFERKKDESAGGAP